MEVIFKAENHKYESVDPTEAIDWTSVTTFVGTFKEKFDAVTQAKKSSKNKRSKWYGIPPEKIQEIWSNKANRAVNNGTWYHDQREADVISIDTIDRAGRAIPIIKPLWNGKVKMAPDQRLSEGIYPEHFVYLKSAGLCGQSDRVEVIKDTIDVIDYKTNEEIKLEGFKNWEGITKKMQEPLGHLDDCNFNHYALQLSTYMYIMLKHNPQYKAGKLILHHVVFEKDGVDEYGDPVLKKDENGSPIVKHVQPYEVPYLKGEVVSMINHIKSLKTI